jgi:hypothetical protein
MAQVDGTMPASECKQLHDFMQVSSACEHFADAYYSTPLQSKVSKPRAAMLRSQYDGSMS